MHSKVVSRSILRQNVADEDDSSIQGDISFSAHGSHIAGWDQDEEVPV